MSFQSFRRIVDSIVRESGEEVEPKITNEDGRYVASFSDGTRITSNSQSHRLCVEWGSGHKAYTEGAIA